MTDSILYLLAILIVANVLLMGVAIARSMTRRRRASHGATVPPASTSRPMTSVANPPADSPVAPAPDADDAPILAAHPRGDGGAPDRHADRAAAARPSGTASSIDEAARIDRYGRPATVVFVELDGLERLTGALGPGAADRVLPALADVLGRQARGADYVARLGPGRFGILLTGDGRSRGGQLRRAGPCGVRALARIRRDRDAAGLRLGRSTPGRQP